MSDDAKALPAAPGQEADAQRRERVNQARGAAVSRGPARSLQRPLAGTARHWVAALVVLVLAAALPPAVADPYEADPDLAARDADYAAGRSAAGRGDWAEAVLRFERAERRHPDHADLHNALGYAYRNLKQYEPALRHYRRAIEIDPRHRGAHEYIGETYLLLRDRASAEKHLAALRAICLLPCDELKDLEQAMANAPP
jgi:Flp pilus assembly protein TadD